MGFFVWQTKLIFIFLTIRAKQTSEIMLIMAVSLLPDLLRAESSAGHSWSSIVANFSCPNWDVAGSSDKSTSSSEDIPVTAGGHQVMAQIPTDSHKHPGAMVWAKRPATYKEHWGQWGWRANKE